MQSAAVYVHDRSWFKTYYETEPAKDLFEIIQEEKIAEQPIQSTVIEETATTVEIIPQTEIIQDVELVETSPVEETEEVTEAISFQPKSFNDWLQTFSISKDGKVSSKVPETAPTNGNDELEVLIQSNIPYEMVETKLEAETHYAKGLDAFIQQQKQIKNAAVGAPHFDENTKLPVTETFAKLLVAQQKLKQAISVYEKLSLKFPSKTAYFAARIQELREKI